MESKSVQLASITDKLNSQFSSVTSHLSEPISVTSSKEIEELQTEINDIEKIHQTDRKQNLDEITQLEKTIKDAGGDPSQYSNISSSGLKKKYDEIDQKIKQKKRSIS